LRYRKNKNILGIQEKGTNMRVIQDGKKLSMQDARNQPNYVQQHRIATDDKTASISVRRRSDATIVWDRQSAVVQNKATTYRSTT
jgi:hypothetical protein